MTTSSSRGHQVGPAALLVLIALGTGTSACRKDEPDVCRIDYELIAGEPSERFDVFEVDRGRNVVTRLSYPDGRSGSEAIYYFFDDAGNMRLESLDRRANGDIEARLDAQEVIGGVLVPYTVDMNVQDGAIDLAQYSLIVPTTRIGPWNPARIFYQLPCDQNPASESVDPATGERTIVFEADLSRLPTPPTPPTPDADGSAETPGDGSTDEGSGQEGSGQGDPSEPSGPGEPGTSFPPGTRTVMTISYDEAGRAARWAIDTNGDSIPNDTAVLTYNELGYISELYWTRPGRFFGQVYSRGRWTYDTEGKLYAFELDANGDLTYESRAIYHEVCFEGGAQ